MNNKSKIRYAAERLAGAHLIMCKGITRELQGGDELYITILPGDNRARHRIVTKWGNWMSGVTHEILSSVGVHPDDVLDTLHEWVKTDLKYGPKHVYFYNNKGKLKKRKRTVYDTKWGEVIYELELQKLL